jgi:acetyl esterase/lipase
MAELHADVVYSVVPGFRPLALDVYAGSEARAMCVFLHGGGWRLGSRRDGPGPTGPDSQALFHRMTDRGLAVASIDYRLSGEAHHPAQLDDVVAACRYLAGQGDELGVGGLPLTLWGVSAGAHLAALCALASPVGDEVSAVSCWSAPSDLLALPDDVDAVGGTGDRGAGSRESMLLGAPLGDVPELAREASPVNHVAATTTSFQLVHGTADVHVPGAQSDRFAAALERAGAPVVLVRVEGADHFYRTIDHDRLVELVDASIDFLCDPAAGSPRSRLSTVGEVGIRGPGE